MKRYYIIYALALAALFSGCQKQENLACEEGARRSINVTAPGGATTRTVLDKDLNVWWEYGDEVSAFLGDGTNQKYVLRDGSGRTIDGRYVISKGIFYEEPRTDGNITGGTEVDKEYVVYPYSPFNELWYAWVNFDGTQKIDTGIYMDIPTWQEYVEYRPGSFAPGMNPSIACRAVGSDEDFVMQNILGGIEIQLTGDCNVYSISIQSNSNSNATAYSYYRAIVGMDPDGHPAFVHKSDWSDCIFQLNCSGSRRLSLEPTSFFIMLPPQEYPEGFTLTIESSEGTTVKTTGNPLKIERSKITPIKPIAIKPKGSVTTLEPKWIGPCSAEIPCTVSTEETVGGTGIAYSSANPNPEVGGWDTQYWMVLTSENINSMVINELKPNTTYYARAFFSIGDENGQKIYGNVVEFTTKEISYSYEYIDLGLSVKWATCNLGSSSQENVGGYYRWGETFPSCYSDSYKWSGEDWRVYTKYNESDGKTRLDLEDDAAYANLGDKWRMPTSDEQYELSNMCTWTAAQLNGVDGSLVTGPNGESIFIPVSEGNSIGLYAEIMSSDFSRSNNYYYVYCLSFRVNENKTYYASTFRYDGHPIRPVYDERP